MPRTTTLKLDWDDDTINTVRTACLAAAEVYESMGSDLPGLWNLNDAVRLRTAAEDIRMHVATREAVKQSHIAGLLREFAAARQAQEGTS